ncbi:MAG: hypothetical protein IJ862_03870 [Selenomonadaceae bacterium]|nr:hypothetical protein [Selenomonadaceae bacterium]
MAIKNFLKKLALAVGLMNMSLGLLYPNTIYAEEENPLIEKVVQAASYDYGWGDDESETIARKKALLRAEIRALEMVCTFITEYTEVEDFKVTEDNLKSLTHGTIALLNDPKFDIDRNNRRCTVTIQARVTVDVEAMRKRIEEIVNPKPEPTKPEPIKPEPIKPEPIKPEPIKPEPDPIKQDPINMNSVGIDKSKATLFKGHYYQIVDVGMTWNDASMACENQGGHLVTIGSVAEQKFIETLLNQGQRNNYWLGAKRAPNGKFVWIDKTPFAYANWASGQPDNIRSKALMVYKNTNPKAPKHKFGLWNDVSSEGVVANEEDFFGLNHFGFICEWDS